MRFKFVFFIYGVLFMLLITSVVVLNNEYVADSSGSGGKGGISGQVVQKDQVAQYLQSQAIVRDLPKDAMINLRFYNFNTGVREWEKSYKITRDYVQEGVYENPEAEIIIHSKYLQDLTGDNLCEIIRLAHVNGDLDSQLKISRTGFLWKYRDVLKYNCFS